MKKEIWEVFGYLLEIFSYSSIEMMKKDNPVYEEILTTVFRLEDEYKNLNLSEENQKIIDELLSQRTLVEIETTRSAYLAGIWDCYKALRDSKAALI